MPKRALLIIDLQNDYFPGGLWPLAEIEAAAANAKALLEAGRAAGDLVIHVQHVFERADAPFFRPDSDGAAIHATLRPSEGELSIVKHKPNAFRGTDLKAQLDAHGIEDLTVCGAMSHMCVDAAVRAAADLGYNVTLIHDACAGRDIAFGDTEVPAAMAHAAFMHALGFAYAQLLTTETYLQTEAAAA